jgi:hypothetical protein
VPIISAINGVIFYVLYISLRSSFLRVQLFYPSFLLVRLLDFWLSGEKHGQWTIVLVVRLYSQYHS